MPKHIKLRTMTEEEKTEIQRLAKSRTEAIRMVQRARIVAAMTEDPQLHASEAGLRAGYRSKQAGPLWIKRFNSSGIAGLSDAERPGRQPVHSEEVKSQLIALATRKPSTLGYPYALWTLERLQTAFEERHQVHLSDSTIWTWLDDEGFVWKRQQSWFHEPERHDPEFVEKRGASSRPT